MEALLGLGIGLILVGAALFIASIFLGLEKERDEEGEEEGRSRVEGGAVLFVGPIPIVFGSDKRVARDLLILGLVLFLFTVVFYLFVVR